MSGRSLCASSGVRGASCTRAASAMCVSIGYTRSVGGAIPANAKTHSPLQSQARRGSDRRTWTSTRAIRGLASCRSKLRRKLYGQQFGVDVMSAIRSSRA